MAGQGVQFLPLSRIPEKWDPVWFGRWIREVLANADIRNAIEGSGITITGQPGEAATVSTSADLTNLLLQTFVLTAPSGFLNFERVLAGEPGVITIVDGGANSNVTVSITNNGVNLGKLVQLSQAGVLGNPVSGVGGVQNINPIAALSVLHYDGTLITFDVMDSTYVSDFVEAAQDAVGAMLVDSASIDFTYTDATPALTATVITANPSGLIGMVAVNGSAATPLRSDGLHAIDPAIAPTWSGKHTHTLPIKLAGFTVATLPAGTIGDRAYVTDALTPTYNAAAVGGGAVKVPVFHNGTTWVTA